MSGTRDENLFMARLAEQAERYEDMIEYMKRVATMGTDLNVDERNLLSVAYKNYVSARRNSWRQMTLLEQREGGDRAAWIADYRRTVESELEAKCNDIISILDTHLIPQAQQSSSMAEPQAFFMKMKGDYFRYSAEFQRDAQAKATAADSANGAYASALQHAEASLGAANPVRLGLALNYSVFFNEVMKDPAQAMELARKTCESGNAGLPALSEEEQRDSSQILQLLTDNLQLWQSGAKPGEAQLDGTAVEDL
mmetsp:Transcript_48601/g.122645  ORF Transcript_48601/g.122645 Transcript_48601/m.122645 type:complete len:253 (-) Transcript_48601:132-890(-)